MEHTNTLCGQNVGSYYVKVGSAYSLKISCNYPENIKLARDVQIVKK
jgi:hypothetical protein